MPRLSSRCPHCGQYVTKNTKFCRKCGLELEICKECEVFNPWFADYCHNCGLSMAIEPSITPTEEQRKVVFGQDQDLNALDETLLAIIKLRDGSISISEVSSTLGVSRENLAQSIERLQRSHLIEKAS